MSIIGAIAVVLVSVGVIALICVGCYVLARKASEDGGL